MKDASKQVTKALPNASANNNTNTIDLGVERPFDSKFRLAYVLVSVPALTDHVDSTKSDTFVMQDSADDSSYANTNPAITCSVPGVASTGSLATTFKVPLPPGVRRYVQFTQTVPSGGGTGSNATVTYDLVT